MKPQTSPRQRQKMLRLLDFEPARPLVAADRDAFKRRYSILFADDGAGRRGGLGLVRRVTNAYGEVLALKTLLLPGMGTDYLPAGSGDPDATILSDRRQEALLAAFRAEYESQRALQELACVPKLLGWGIADGAPAVLMEWVEGITLARAQEMLAIDDADRVSPPVVAALGRDLYAVLDSLAGSEVPVVHRDVSPTNVMVRTSRRSVDQQVADGSFDLCLVDFGSSVAGPARLGSLTRAGVACRWATPDYAPPEMLTDDIPGVAELRRSPAIDVYAAASTLYELACGAAPFAQVDDSAAAELSPYRLKVDCAPASPVLAHGGDGALDAILSREPEVESAVAEAAQELPQPLTSEECSRDLQSVDDQIAQAIMCCLSVDQDARPSAATMSSQYATIAAYYAANVGHALRGEPLEPHDAATAGASPMRARRVLRIAAYAAATAMLVAVCAVGAAQIQSGASFLLALPFALGLALRARDRATRVGAVRGLLGILLGAMIDCVTFMRLLPAGLALRNCVPALVAACAAAWLPIAVDYATLSD